MYCKCLPYMMDIGTYSVIESTRIWVQDLDDYVIECVNRDDIPDDISIGGIFYVQKKYPDIMIDDDRIEHNGIMYYISLVRAFNRVMVNLVYPNYNGDLHSMLELPVDAKLTTHRVLYVEKVSGYFIVRNLIRIDKGGLYYFFSMVYSKNKLLGVYSSSSGVSVDRRFCLPKDLETKLRLLDKSVMNKEALKCLYQ